MKTTLDIADNILLRAKSVAKARHVTLRQLTEEGLRLVVDAGEMRKPHKVKPVVFKGKGLNPAFQGAPWAAIRDEAYRGRGS